jgi:hypothetical protein
MNIDIQGNTVTPYKSIKLLGVNIDCQLIFRDHISEVCKKSGQRESRSNHETTEHDS